MLSVCSGECVGLFLDKQLCQIRIAASMSARFFYEQEFEQVFQLCLACAFYAEVCGPNTSASTFAAVCTKFLFLLKKYSRTCVSQTCKYFSEACKPFSTIVFFGLASISDTQVSTSKKMSALRTRLRAFVFVQRPRWQCSVLGYGLGSPTRQFRVLLDDPDDLILWRAESSNRGKRCLFRFFQRAIARMPWAAFIRRHSQL